jgi:YrhK-like protein
MRSEPSLSYRHLMPNKQRRHQRLQSSSNITAAALFVIGCIGFYSPRLHTAATTAFLIGSVLFLVSALGAMGSAHHRPYYDQPEPQQPQTIPIQGDQQ